MASARKRPPEESTAVAEAAKQDAEFESFYDDREQVPEFWRDKYDKEASKFWDKFYGVNKTNFFKDRHWLLEQWPELRTGVGSPQVRMVEVGCGVGNTIFPLMEQSPSLYTIGLDFAPTAIQLVKANAAFDPKRQEAHVCDISAEQLSGSIPLGSCDFATLIFCLSAITPQKMPTAIANVVKLLKPGGSLLFRDYAAEDLAAARFEAKGNPPGVVAAHRPAEAKGEKKLGENFYVRGDGTQAYYFSEAELRKLFTEAGLEVQGLQLVEQQLVNRKEDRAMQRRFWSGRAVLRNSTAAQGAS